MAPIFNERQYLFANPVLWIVAAVMVGGFVAIGPSVDALPGFAMSMLILPAVAAMNLRTAVFTDRIKLRYWPFFWKTIPLADVQSARAVTFRPLRDWGGWGLRGLGKRKAWTSHGNTGVLLELTDGRQFTIGSQRPQALAAALQTLVPRR